MIEVFLNDYQIKAYKKVNNPQVNDKLQKVRGKGLRFDFLVEELIYLRRHNLFWKKRHYHYRVYYNGKNGIQVVTFSVNSNSESDLSWQEVIDENRILGYLQGILDGVQLSSKQI